jgi:PIN domain nuclease of toxin-antitoxin system
MGGPEVKDLLLDTHVWIWLSIEKKDSLSVRARRSIQKARHKWISAISCWELAKLVEKGRISFSIPTLTWILRSLSELGIYIVELSPEIAVESTQLPDFHQDPADQTIVATSRVLGMPLVTSDNRILDYLTVETIW